MKRTAMLPIVLVSLSLLTIKCTRSTDTLYREGRLLVRLDAASWQSEWLCLEITAEVGGYEPFKAKIFDFETTEVNYWMEKNMVASREDALNWNDYYNKKLIDVAGQMLEGGSEAEVTVLQPGGHSQRASLKTFQIDGNAIIKIYYAASDAMPGSMTQLMIERLQ